MPKDFTFAWAPSSDADGGAISYEIEVTENGLAVATGATPGTSFTLPDSLGKGDYAWTVTAIDAQGNESVSAASPFTVKGGGGGGGGCSVATTRSAASAASLTFPMLALFALALRRRAAS